MLIDCMQFVNMSKIHSEKVFSSEGLNPGSHTQYAGPWARYRDPVSNPVFGKGFKFSGYNMFSQSEICFWRLRVECN